MAPITKKQQLPLKQDARTRASKARSSELPVENAKVFERQEIGSKKLSLPAASSGEVADDGQDTLTGDSREMLRFVLFRIDEKFEELRRDIVSEMRAKDEKIEELEKQISGLKRDGRAMEERLDEFEANGREDEFIMSGKAMSTPSSSTAESTTVTVCELLKSKLNYVLPPDSVVQARRLGKKPDNQSPDERKILVKVRGYQTKNYILQACKTVKPPSMFVNDHLTPTRARILFALRQARRRKPNIVSGCGSVSGSVYVWVKPSEPSAKNQKIYLNTWLKLEKFCSVSLQIDSSVLLGDVTSH